MITFLLVEGCVGFIHTEVLSGVRSTVPNGAKRQVSGGERYGGRTVFRAERFCNSEALGESNG